MAISDRTRKLLWGRSGNRCAICRHPLVAEATSDDPAAVIGDECHIIAQSPGGPRAQPTYTEDPDSETNLILLCRTDHKRVDDQPKYFTPERLRAIKLGHESWVHTSLSNSTPAALNVRIRRDPRPSSLALVEDGAALLALVIGAEGYDFGNDELANEEEVELISSFLQMVQDYGEAGDDLESGARVRARFELSRELTELARAGFLVYGAEVRNTLEGGIGSPVPWVVAILRVTRLENVVRDAQSVLLKQEEPDHSSQTT